MGEKSGSIKRGIGDSFEALRRALETAWKRVDNRGFYPHPRNTSIYMSIIELMVNPGNLSTYPPFLLLLRGINFLKKLDVRANFPLSESG
jgi:hypothetical protein